MNYDRICTGCLARRDIRGIVFVLLAMSPVTAVATVTTWDGPATGGVFNDDNNWNVNSPGDNSPLPNGPNDHAIIGGGVNVDGTITFDADATPLREDYQIEFCTSRARYNQSVEIEKEGGRCNCLGYRVLEAGVTPDVHPQGRQAAHVGKAKRIIGSSRDPVEFVLEATWPHRFQ